jgi:hypothetical protein
MNRPLRCIQIGVGGWGHHWCTRVLPRLKALGLAESVAAVDLDPAVLPKAAEQLGLPESRLYTSAAQALAEQKADFVTIVVPPSRHEAIADLAVRHGCHILSEKPIADTMEACCRIHRKVRAAGLKMAVTMSLFCRWLLGGAAPPNTLDDNIQCAALLFAAIESAHMGRVVDVQAFLRRHASPQPGEVRPEGHAGRPAGP